MEEGGAPPGLGIQRLSPLEASNLDGQVVQSVRDFGDRGFDSGSKIEDHSSGDRRVFNASFSVLSRVGERREDFRDIVHPTIVRVT